MKKRIALGLLLAGIFGRARPEELHVAAPDAGVPAGEFNVRDYGAKGDGHSKDTAAIQKAIEACAAAGGGLVRLTAGTYRSGSIFLKSRVTLQLDAGAVLLGSDAVDDYPTATVRWEGTDVDGHCSLVHAENAEHIAITGSGTISGADPTTPIRVPRGPMLVEFRHCRDVRVQGVTLKNRGIWTLHPTYCDDVVVDRVTFETRGRNSDGVDPDSCRRVAITDCSFSTEDDCIAIKSGKGEQGRRLALPSQDIVIRGCVFHSGHSLALGSECSGGIRRVTIEGCRFEEGMKCGVRIKTNPGRGGFIEDVEIRDIDFKAGPGAGFLEVLMKLPYNPDPAPQLGLEGITRIGGIRVENVRMSGGKVALVKGDGAKPISGFVLRAISGRAAEGVQISNVTGVELEGLTFDVDGGAKVGARNASGIGLEGAAPWSPDPE